MLLEEARAFGQAIAKQRLDLAPVSAAPRDAARPIYDIRRSRPWARSANVIDRSSRIPGSGGDWSKVKPLFRDRLAEGARFFKKHGFAPVNHAYIIRGDIYRKYPWVAFNLYAAFVKAKALAKEKLLERIPSALFFGPEYAAMTREIIGDDPFPFGIKANKAMLDTIIGFSHEQ